MTISKQEILNASILIVDDQQCNVLLLEQMLRAVGYVYITTTMDPCEVCELYRKNRYDLILLDLQMPGLDGFQVMEGLEKIETNGYLPVLVITAQPDHKLHALAAGAKDFIAKPFDLVEVQTRIHNMLEVRLLYSKLENANQVMEQTVLERTAELRASEARLNLSQQMSSTGGWDLNMGNHTTNRTLGHDRIFGYESLLPEWTHEMFLEHVLPEDRARVDLIFRDAEAANTIWNFECRIRRADGEVRWIWVFSERQYDDDGAVRHISGSVQDITGRKGMENKLRNLAGHLQTLREEEKTSFAREIHDDLGGTLTALKLESYYLAEVLSANEKTAPLLKHTELLGQLTDNATSAMRRIITGLRPTMLDDLGLRAAIEYHAAQFHEINGIECQLNCMLDKGDEGKLSGMQSTHLFRILQEALTNVVKHSQASRVAVEMQCSDGEITLSISDNGHGMPKNHVVASNSYGMLGMNERIAQLGGKIKFGKPPGGGFSVMASLPLACNT